jgi:arginyl-tRNA synthetase
MALRMQTRIKKEIERVLGNFSVEGIDFDIIFTEFQNGDYASNVALVASKQIKKNPTEFAQTLKENLDGKIEGVEKIEVAGPGFLNFYLSTEEISSTLELSSENNFGENHLFEKKNAVVEYAQPNPFKPLHIGHVMAITIGESISRFFENAGALVNRANYQGDVGRHVACAIYGVLNMEDEKPSDDASDSEVADYLGRAYVFGTKALEDVEAKEKIQEINKKVFERSDDKINKIYDWGRERSLKYFETIYTRLGSRFDNYFFESEVADDGMKVVKENLGKVFEESEGAVVFRGENFGLHTRVFINQDGLPTYEAKELGLMKRKLDLLNPDISITETGNEQKNYFEVVLKAASLIYPEIAEKTKHITHGMMRLPSGKMSSRLGNVISGESLIAGVENLVLAKLEERGFSDEEKRSIVADVAVGAIKYSILKQALGKDIHFDFEKSISFEGDSGPYMQYTAVRIKSLIKKAEEEGIGVSNEDKEEPAELERMIYRFPEIVKRATEELSPQHLATYLIDLSSLYNSYYASHPVIGNKYAPYRLFVSRATLEVITRGLWLLGIKVPERM